MKIRKLAARLAGSLLSASLICPASFAQVSPERLHAIRSRLQQIRIMSERMPASQRKVLSSGALNLFEVADKFDDIEGAVNRRQPSSLSVTSQQAIPGMPLEATDGVVRVSNPAQDIFSVLSGFTQSETHTAWCGNNVVVGFNDSGSFFESLVANVGGVSFNGVARSTNQGAS